MCITHFHTKAAATVVRRAADRFFDRVMPQTSETPDDVGRGSPPSGRPRKTAPVNSMRRLPADVDGPVPEPAAVGIIDGAVMPATSRGRRGDDRPHRDACGRSRHDRGRPPSVVPDAAAPRPGPWHGPAWRPGPPKPQVRAIALRRAWPPHGMGRSARPSPLLPCTSNRGRGGTFFPLFR